jgi:hypothetical protein
MAVFGRSLLSTLVVEILLITSMPETILPNTGCLAGEPVNRGTTKERQSEKLNETQKRKTIHIFSLPGSQKSKEELCLVFIKNCDPPELGAPVLAMERVPGSLEIFGQNLSLNSSGIDPSASRVILPLPGTS